jgi:WD40 repeat protein
MTEASGDTPSVIERTRPIAAGAAVAAAHFFGDTPVFVLGEETLLFAPKDGERRVSAHDGGILSVAADATRIITGGDDGKVVVTGATGDATLIATDGKRRWIDHVAAGPDGATAWSAGKQAFVKTAKGDERSHEVASSVGGLAFTPKGFRLAIAHYNGATLWFPNAAAKPDVLEWKGSHVDITFSPDGRFLITAMQEPTLHGWRLTDGKHMRMSGYSAKVRSLSWAADGKWLATSGSTQLILWPFQGKDGPMGKQPELLTPREQRVVRVACHPTQEITAVGFDDGMVVLVRINDGAEVLARSPGPAPISALAWNATGTLLAFGTENGDAGVIDLA